MLYHPKHDHWHFKASAQYSLVDPRNGDAVVSARSKVSFCLRDTARVPVEYGTWAYREVYGTCTKRSPQGISVGWMDIYQSFLAGQRLVLPEGLADGLYCLHPWSTRSTSSSRATTSTTPLSQPSGPRRRRCTSDHPSAACDR